MIGSSPHAVPGAGDVRVTPESFAREIAARRDAAGRLADGSRFLLAPGHYHLAPAAYVDSTCGNCEDPDTPVAATLGLRLAGRGIALEGEDADSVVIHTHAGYGLLFQDCDDCALRKVTVTGGVRDPDPNVTDAAVLVQRSRVVVDGCVIKGNLGDSTLIAENVVGIIGIAGREGAEIYILRNRILRNSWDGIALYRGAKAVIGDNLIDGVDKAGGRTRGGGRGVGIGVTWDARATIYRNRVTRYWKGIGLFVDAHGIVQNNVVEEMLTWGIALWDAGRGKPVGLISGNIIYDTGACGFSLTRSEPGFSGDFLDNVVALTGQNPKYDDPEYYCAQCPIAVHARPRSFVIGGNRLWNNRRGGGDEIDELCREGASDIEELPAFPRALSAHAALRDARCFSELPWTPPPPRRDRY